MNNKETTELVRRFPEVFATLREYIEKLERENEALRTALKTALAIESLDESNLDELIARCRSVIREQKIKQMTDAASLDIGHSCLSGDRWMRGDPI
jgi:hypothetical protein